MIRHYGAQRCMGGHNPLRVGVIPARAIFYLQDEGWWRERYRSKPICRTPWIVEAFLNGTMGPPGAIAAPGFGRTPTDPAAPTWRSCARSATAVAGSSPCGC